MNPYPARRLAFLVAPLAFALVGCSASEMRVVDIDDGYRPIAGATITRYQTPRRATDPWPTEPADVQQTDAGGKCVLRHDSGRFVVTAPGKAPAAFTSLFPPRSFEVGLSGGAPAK